MKLFSLPDGTVDRLDRAQWLTCPFDLAYDEQSIIPAGKADTYVRRVNKPDQTPLRRVEVPTGTVRRV